MMPALARGQPRHADVEERIRTALAALDDPIALEAMSLTSRPSVQFVAQNELRGRTCADGVALSRVLRLALADVARDLGGFPVGVLAQVILDGRPQREAAIELNITEEHVSRRWKPVLLALVRERLDSFDVLALARQKPPHSGRQST